MITMLSIQEFDTFQFQNKVEQQRSLNIEIRAVSGRVFCYPNTRSHYPTRPDTRPEVLKTWFL